MPDFSSAIEDVQKRTTTNEAEFASRDWTESHCKMMSDQRRNGRFRKVARLKLKHVDEIRQTFYYGITLLWHSSNRGVCK